MKPDSTLASKIADGDFIVTAEYRPPAGTDATTIEAMAGTLGNGPVAVNVADNSYGVTLSSLAASVALCRSGIEPVYQLTTRDRNRIALQSDLKGAAYLGIKNVLCLSGYHQTLTGCAGAANVYDIDSIQLIAAVRRISEMTILVRVNELGGDLSWLSVLALLNAVLGFGMGLVASWALVRSQAASVLLIGGTLGFALGLGFGAALPGLLAFVLAMSIAAIESSLESRLLKRPEDIRIKFRREMIMFSFFCRSVTISVVNIKTEVHRRPQ